MAMRTTISPLELPGVLEHPLFAGAIDTNAEEPKVSTSHLAARVKNIRMGRVMVGLPTAEVVSVTDALVLQTAIDSGREPSWGRWTAIAASVIADQIATQAPDSMIAREV